MHLIQVFKISILYNFAFKRLIYQKEILKCQKNIAYIVTLLKFCSVKSCLGILNSTLSRDSDVKPKYYPSRTKQMQSEYHKNH